MSRIFGESSKDKVSIIAANFFGILEALASWVRQADIDSIFNDFEKEHDEWNNKRDQFESLVRRQWTDGYCFAIQRCIHRLEDSFCLDEFDKYMREDEVNEDKIDT